MLEQASFFCTCKLLRHFVSVNNDGLLKLKLSAIVCKKKEIEFSPNYLQGGLDKQYFTEAPAAEATVEYVLVGSLNFVIRFLGSQWFILLKYASLIQSFFLHLAVPLIECHAQKPFDVRPSEFRC